MPTSALEVWPRLVNMCWQVNPVNVLDVGPGHGKAGILLREYIGTTHRGNGPIECVDAVEAEPRYIDGFPWLDAVYDDVISADATTLTAEKLAKYDLVVMSDVIEHMDKDAAMALIDRIDGHVVVSTPIDFFQNPEADEGWETERHRSHWTVADFPRVESVAGELVALGCLLLRLAKKETS